MFAKAAVGSVKNIVPKRLIARSNRPGVNGKTSASACSKLTLRRCAAAARSRARSTAEAETSIPTTEPARAARAASREVCPVPQPMSSTWS